MLICVPWPTPTVPVDHSPAPSTVMIAAWSNGEQKNDAAACDMWCSQNRIFFGSRPSFSRISGLIHSLSVTQRRIDSVNTLCERGKVAKAVVSRRSNLRNGFS